MLEANTFRSMMLVGGVMALAVIIACFFTAPIVSVDAQAKKNYENLMGADLAGKNHLTGYQALLFMTEGKIRGTTVNY